MDKTAQHISVAPMMDWTDRHCRYFHRLIAPHVRLYTEMVTTGALLHGDTERFLKFNNTEHPLALQLGGSEPEALAQCASMGAERGYDEINLNCGCPSDRVQNGRFGACLMAEPELVARCYTAMRNAVPDIPVTVKCRIGIDDYDEYAFSERFIRALADAGCETVILHARKALLSGLSPKENREIPPLRYDIAAALKEAFPKIRIVLNGGIQNTEAIRQHLEYFDGVMIGRAAYRTPWILAEIEEAFYNHTPAAREDIALAMIPYIREQETQSGIPPRSIIRHMLGLFHGCPGGRIWRRALSAPDLRAESIEEALKLKFASAGTDLL